MINDINNKILKLEKKRLMVQILSLVFWVLSFKVSADSINYVMPMTELMICITNNFLEINEFYSDLLLFFMEFVYKNLPLMVYIGGRIKIFSISRNIHKLEKDKAVVIENEKKKKEDIKVIDYEEILRVYDIVDRFESLPRGKQMEVLNFIKGDLNSFDNDMSIQIMKLDEKHRNMLQTECEDILFPDFNEEDVNYSKVKKK